MCRLSRAGYSNAGRGINRKHEGITGGYVTYDLQRRSANGQISTSCMVPKLTYIATINALLYERLHFLPYFKRQSIRQNLYSMFTRLKEMPNLVWN